ncbi:MAG: divergent PAP2 family protein [Ruminococcaceae bacterium]|nr:divergent PAP2 family protein [Oscillospiraceae bacterium]
MNYVNQFLSNRTSMACLTAWFLAQFIKIIIELIIYKKLDFRRIMGSGGMPSSHSSLVCCMAASVGKYVGLDQPLFAVAAVMAFIVMYDALNVRRAAGEQAKVLNYMMLNWKDLKPEMFSNELKELLGHTPIQVFVGALMGITIGILF